MKDLKSLLIQLGFLFLHSVLGFKDLIKRIKKNEGFSLTPYKDQLGFLTIGYGHLILLDEKKLLEKKINKKHLEMIFINDFNKALSDFNKFLNPLSKNQKDSELLIEMIFQIGIVKVLMFKKLLRNVNNSNRFMVCFEMMNSIWYKQTPVRVKKLIIEFLK